MTIRGAESVTVVMATHNAMPYLPEAVDSIRSQTLTNWRLLIVDDASTDDSRSYLEGMTDPRIEVIRLHSNIGQGAARNLALARCETPYVAVMDSDDIAHPDRLTAQVEFLQANPSVGVVGTQFTYLGASGRTGFGAWLPCDHQGIFENLLSGKHAIVNGTACYRVDLFRECGGYASGTVGEDWNVYLQIGMRSQLANLKERYYYYRVHRGSTTATRLHEMRAQYAFAGHNARRRLAGLSEVSFATFEEESKRSSLFKRLDARREVAALSLYRAAVSSVLHGNPVAGYPQLALAASLAPGMAVHRLVRAVQSCRHKLTHQYQSIS